jgi:hypothetical protein
MDARQGFYSLARARVQKTGWEQPRSRSGDGGAIIGPVVARGNALDDPVCVRNMTKTLRKSAGKSNFSRSMPVERTGAAVRSTQVKRAASEWLLMSRPLETLAHSHAMQNFRKDVLNGPR